MANLDRMIPVHAFEGKCLDARASTCPPPRGGWRFSAGGSTAFRRCPALPHLPSAKGFPSPPFPPTAPSRHGRAQYSPSRAIHPPTKNIPSTIQPCAAPPSRRGADACAPSNRFSIHSTILDCETNTHLVFPMARNYTPRQDNTSRSRKHFSPLREGGGASAPGGVLRLAVARPFLTLSNQRPRP